MNKHNVYDKARAVPETVFIKIHLIPVIHPILNTSVIASIYSAISQQFLKEPRY